MRWCFGSLLMWSAVSSGCLFKASSSQGGGQIAEVKEPSDRELAVDVPAGYRIELVATGLTFPTGIAFGADGAIYVTESGYSYGEVVMPAARVVELDPRSLTGRREVARGKHAPWNGLAFHDGALYVAQGGALDGGRIVRIGLDGTQRVLVDGLPSLGDHHTNGPIVVDGWLYFGQGTVTNSGVVGVDNHAFGWLRRHPDLHDTPCRDVVLAGTNFKSQRPWSKYDREVLTGAYRPFGTPSAPGQVIRGQTRCNGAILRVRLDGSDLEVVAWGLRNPYGLASAADGTIYLTENGADVRGSRPVFGAADVVWRLESGAWYGWPDHAKGQPLTMSQYSQADGAPRGFVLAAHPGKPPQPAGVLGVHASANGFDIARGGRFGHAGHAFIALFGDMAPEVGKVLGPVGFKVVRLDLQTGIVVDFARNRGPRAGPASRLGLRGLERPIAARFDPAGEALYVVDFGVMRMTEQGPAPRPGTGAVWRIAREVAGARDR